MIIFIAKTLSCIAFLPILCLSQENYGRVFFEIAVNQSKKPSGNETYGMMAKVHLIRVPKAGSTSLSVVARRIAGCEPRGPCCAYPGDPPGTCPSAKLIDCELQGRVVGCTHHRANYPSLLDPNTPSISIMREPISRAISGFFYPGIHHNSHCTGHTSGLGPKHPITSAALQRCFAKYLTDEKWKNPTVKMLAGAYAYGNELTCLQESKCKRSYELAAKNVDKLAFMGISEMWELSMLILHIRLPRLQPLLDDFHLSGEGSSSSNKGGASSGKGSASSGKGGASSGKTNITTTSSLSTSTASSSSDSAGLLSRSRENKQANYLLLKKEARSDKYKDQLRQQNKFDIMLYENVTHRMCDELHRLDLWKPYKSIRKYWQEKSPFKSAKCP